jgi:undecaprenyl-diphosphatase
MIGSIVGALSRLDAAAFAWMVARRWSPFDVPIMLLSSAARGGGLWILLGVLTAFVRPSRWPAFVQLLLAIGLAGLLADGILKPVISRQRPFETQADLRTIGIPPLSRSFPSGHAATSFAGAFALSRMIPGWSLSLWALSFVVAFSRIYLGMHYPLDVIGGALVGLAAAAFVVGGSRWYSHELAARHLSHTDVAR